MRKWAGSGVSSFGAHRGESLEPRVWMLGPWTEGTDPSPHTLFHWRPLRGTKARWSEHGTWRRNWANPGEPWASVTVKWAHYWYLLPKSYLMCL